MDARRHHAETARERRPAPRSAASSANWRPFAWMQNDGTIGVDLADRRRLPLCRCSECPPRAPRRASGSVTDNRRTIRNFSAKIDEHVDVERRDVDEPQDDVRRATTPISRTTSSNTNGTQLAAGRADALRGGHDAAPSNSSRRRRRRSASTCRSRRRSAIACSSRPPCAPTRTARSARTSSASSTRRPASRGSCPTSRSSRNVDG